MEIISLLKVNSYQDKLPEKLAQLLEPLGGLDSFCKKGDSCLLKPNFIMARPVESGATTHPALIVALVSLLHDLGCRIAVGDSPGLGSAAGVIRKLNLADDFKRFGVKIVELETPVLQQRHSADFSRFFKNLHLAAELNEYPVIINLPKLKSHGQMGLSLATKNLFGCVAGPAKLQWHYAVGRDYAAFARLLLEIALTVNASLHILDGIIGMDGNGPSNGRVRELNLLMAGTNPIALDRVAVEVLQKDPEQFPIFKAARELDVPGTDMAQIEVRGETVAACAVEDFDIPAAREIRSLLHHHPFLNGLVEWMAREELVINDLRCIKCRQCEDQCPARAIKFNQRIRIDAKRCIKCYCCQEICPVGALAISDPFLMKILKKIWLWSDKGKGKK
jgi:uncharacterized protein (DUF362 family)/Pyruvate/2-oxoacid:ferredoxin oxidoreductase delta subunit